VILTTLFGLVSSMSFNYADGGSGNHLYLYNLYLMVYNYAIN
jgi:hypothetical protein